MVKLQVCDFANYSMTDYWVNFRKSHQWTAPYHDYLVEHRATFCVDNYGFIEFETEEDMTLFLLRFA